MIGEIDRRIARAMGRVRLAFRAVLNGTDSGSGIQLASGTGLAGEPLDSVELMQHYGFTSTPPGGYEGVLIPLGGKTSHSVVVATEHATYRLVGLETGEVALYSDEGTHVVLKRGRVVEVECDVYRVNCKTYEVNASEGAGFNTPTLTASEKAVVNGQLTGKGGLALSNEGGEGDVATISGTMRVETDVIAGGKSVARHHHIDSIGGETDDPLSE